MDKVTLIITIVGGFVSSTALSVYVQGRMQKKKTDADTQEVAAQTYRRLNGDLLKQLTDQKAEFSRQLAEERAEFSKRLNEKDILIGQQATQIKQLVEDNESYIDRINDLEDKVKSLQDQINEMPAIGAVVDTVTAAAHTKIDELAGEVKQALPTTHES